MIRLELFTFWNVTCWGQVGWVGEKYTCEAERSTCQPYCSPIPSQKPVLSFLTSDTAQVHKARDFKCGIEQ